MRLLIFISMLLLFSYCKKDEMLFHRISGKYDAYIKDGTDLFYADLAVQYQGDDKIMVYTNWDGNLEKMVILTIVKKNKRRIECEIKEQSFDTGTTIYGDAIWRNDVFDIYYIIGTDNFFTSYTLIGSK